MSELVLFQGIVIYVCVHTKLLMGKGGVVSGSYHSTRKQPEPYLSS
jgi:hypothetical protein